MNLIGNKDNNISSQKICEYIFKTFKLTHEFFGYYIIDNFKNTAIQN